MGSQRENGHGRGPGGQFHRRPRHGGHEARGAERGRRPAVLGQLHRRHRRPGHHLGRRSGHAQLAERAGQPPLRHRRQNAGARALRFPGSQGHGAGSGQDQRNLRHAGHDPHDHPHLALALGRRAGRTPDAARSRNTRATFVKRNLLPGNARNRHAAGRGAPEETGGFQRQFRLQHDHQGQGTRRRPGLGRLLPVRPRGLSRRLVPEAGPALPVPGQAVPALRRHGRQDLRPGGERPHHRNLRPAGRAAERDHRQGGFPAAGRTVPGRRPRQPGPEGPDAALRRRRASPGARPRCAPAARTPPFSTIWAC